ncbi:MAG: IS1182 family transposase [Immundisolibacter sp.]|uniref:IS1182 family transposase n=1 Tax=Immundisolibacter sp. TaxID=1934948 RepID=UPI0019ACB792|nr:IS1182 family transposase [Immundisolibacter sp.]MBC7161950.1 IS1182 family transposase [Immundisolibacter sp.]
MAARFVPVDRDTEYLFPPSVQEWLPDGHLARFVVDVVNQLDLSRLESAYAGRGSMPYHPSMLLGLLIYGYATGVYSSRAIERATYDSVAFRYVAANTHPDHDTINTFRKLFCGEIESAFRQVLRIAAGMKLVKFGVVSLDGTRIKANASKHSALSYGHAQKLEAQIQAEIAELKRRAAAAEGLPDDLSLPEELQRREDRLAAIRKAKADIEARAAERDAPAQAEYEAKVQAREAQRQQGQKPRGKQPQPPQGGPRDSDQINLTDPESRILPAGSDFVQGYNAQAAVDAASMLILAYDCVQAANDKQQITPMLEPLRALPQQIGEDKDTPIALAADTGYFSEANVEACEAAKITPLIAQKRESHSGWLDRRLAPTPAMPDTPTALEKRRHRLATPEGKAAYGLRKCTVEPTFGIIKQVMRFRQFLVRGLKNVQAEWGLVCLAFNLKRMALLNG